MVKLTGVKEQSSKFRRKYNHDTFKIHSNHIIVLIYYLYSFRNGNISQVKSCQFIHTNNLPQQLIYNLGTTIKLLNIKLNLI